MNVTEVKLAYWNSKNKCRHQISLTAETIMHTNHTPLFKWFWAIYLTAHDKRGIPALRLQEELICPVST